MARWTGRKTYRALYTQGYPTGPLRYQDVDFDPERYRLDPQGVLDEIERRLPEGAYLIRVEEKPVEGEP